MFMTWRAQLYTPVVISDANAPWNAHYANSLWPQVACYFNYIILCLLAELSVLLCGRAAETQCLTISPAKPISAPLTCIQQGVRRQMLGSRHQSASWTLLFFQLHWRQEDRSIHPCECWQKSYQPPSVAFWRIVFCTADHIQKIPDRLWKIHNPLHNVRTLMALDNSRPLSIGVM